MYDDGGATSTPQAVSVAYLANSSNDWVPVSGFQQYPLLFTGNGRNVVTFSPVQTAAIRITVTPQTRKSVAFSEIAFVDPFTSFSRPGSDPYHALDGQTTSSGSDWSSSGSSHNYPIAGYTDGYPLPSNFFTLNFSAPRSVSSVKLWFSNNANDIQPPLSYDIQYWSGAFNGWVGVASPQFNPLSPSPGLNTVSFTPTPATTKIKLVVYNAGLAGTPTVQKYTGLVEFMVDEP